MFAEGAFNAAFVPLYAKRIEQDGEAAADGFASESAAWLFAVVAFLVIVFELTMPWSLNIIAFSMDKTTVENGTTPYDLAVLYAWLTMPYLLFMSMTALFSGVLNTRNHFALAAGVPIVLTLNRGIEIAMFLTLPAAVALYVIPDFLISGLYERGAFTAETTAQVAKALKWFALGLPGFVLLKVLTPAFFARENTRTPMIWAGVSAAINLSLGFILFHAIGFHGLALATSIAAWVNVTGLSVLLLRSGDLAPDAPLMKHLPRVVLASIVMGAGLSWGRALMPDLSSANIVMDFVWLICVTGAGAILYAVAATLLRAYDLADIGADQTREIAAAYFAAGVDPKKAIVYAQSSVRAHSELAWYFNCVARVGWLDRMTQYKDKAGKNAERASVGLYTYPVLQAADILAFKGTHVPVGEDQKQHLELCPYVTGQKKCLNPTLRMRRALI